MNGSLMLNSMLPNSFAMKSCSYFKYKNLPAIPEFLSNSAFSSPYAIKILGAPGVPFCSPLVV